MAIASVSHNFVQKQDAFKDEGLQSRKLTLRLATQLVREYADEMEDGYYLLVKDLPDYEKKILLCDAIDCMDLYEDFVQDPSRLQAAYKEYEKEMQYWIDEVIDEVYQDDVIERRLDSGYTSERSRENGESIWVINN